MDTTTDRRLPVLDLSRRRRSVRVGTEHTGGTADRREQIDVGPERQAVATGPGVPDWTGLIGPNQWPSALPELRDAVLAWQAEALRVTRELLRAFAAALGQPETYFDGWFDEESHQHLKVVRYPGRDTPTDDQGVGAHKDYGFLALLHQDEVGGLQVQPPTVAGSTRRRSRTVTSSTWARCSRSPPVATSLPPATACSARPPAWTATRCRSSSGPASTRWSSR